MRGPFPGCPAATLARPGAIARHDHASAGVGLRGSVQPSTYRPCACACCTPPTGTWAGPSTARTCCRRRRGSSTTWSTRSAPSGSTRCSSSGDVYDRALPPVDAVALCDDALRRLAGDRRPGRADQRQPRLGPPARLRRGPDRRRRHPPAHRRRGGAPAGAARRRRRRRSPSTRSPTSSPTRFAASSAATAAATPRCSARRWPGSAPTWPAGRAPASVVLAHAFVTGGAAQRERARHQRRRRAVGAARRSSTASTTRRWATCTAPSGSPTGSATAARRCRTRSPRSTTPRPCCWSSWAPAGRPGAGRGGAHPGAPAAGPGPRPARRPADRRPLDGARGPLPAGDAHRPGPAARADGAAAPPVPARPRPRLRSRGRGRDGPAPPTPRGCAAAATSRSPTTSWPTSAAPAEPAEDGAAARGASRRARRGRGGPLMRLHRLEVTAFGPFAGTEQVDFDALAARRAVPVHRAHRRRQDEHPGRRLLRALRPGPRRRGTARGAAQRPRSRRAPPEVVLELTLRGRRLRDHPVARSGSGPSGAAPARSPSRPGVLLEERTGDGWTRARPPGSTRPATCSASCSA